MKLRRIQGAVVLAGLLTTVVSAGVIESVRESIAKGSEAAAIRFLQNERTSRGITPELLEAMSWLARAEFENRRYPQAGQFAQESYQLAAELLKKRPLAREPHLEIAVGASIEVQAGVMASTGRLSEAIPYLQSQAKAFAGTKVEPRIQKNLLLLTLEGKPAPPVQGISLPAGRPALLFFWAHWCPDCKAEVPILAVLKKEFAPRGFMILAPTQKYGYVAGGADASAAVETAYIEQVRKTYYPAVIDSPIVVNESNFVRYGASTTPTLVLVDRKGIVRLYHPGAMTYAELRAAILRVL